MVTLEEFVEELEKCYRDGIYFEINSDDARILLSYIKDLQRNFDKASRYQYPDTTGS